MAESNKTGDSSSLSKLAFKGSSKVVTDYFEFAINSILFQRGIYPPEDFQTVKKYGLPLLISNDDEVQDYIQQIMKQVKKWVYGKKIVKLVVVIISKSTGDSIERWEFNIDIVGEETDVKEDEVSKSRSEIQKEIQAIIRQITSLVSYLPILKEDDFTFNVLVYTDPKYETTNIPNEWCDTNGDGKLLEGDNVEQVKFTSFSTDFHQIGTYVSYKLNED